MIGCRTSGRERIMGINLHIEYVSFPISLFLMNGVCLYMVLTLVALRDLSHTFHLRDRWNLITGAYSLNLRFKVTLFVICSLFFAHLAKNK